MYRLRQFYSAVSCRWSSCTKGFSTGSQIRATSRAEHNTSEYDEGPVKFSSSGASKYKAKFSRSGTDMDRLWYEPHVLIVSVIIFLTYFCVLREENDIDVELSKSLYSRVPAMEEVQLKAALEYNLDRGLDTTDIVKRLKEIEREREGNK